MKKKIVFRSGSLRMGGLERVLIEVLQTIDKDKYEIILVIDDDCGENNIFEKDIPKEVKYYFLKSQDLIQKIEGYRLKKKNLIFKLLYNFYLNYSTRIMFKNMEKLIKEIGNIDILVDFDAGATKYIDKLNIKRKIVWIHNSIPNLKKKKDKIERFGKRLEHYDTIVAICDEMKEELENIYPKLKGKIRRIYNPFNFERIEKLSEDCSEINDEQKKMLKDNYCIAISRLDTLQKDYLTIIKAFSRLKEKHINKKLYIIGDGPSKEEIKKYIEDYKLEDQVKLLGRFKNPYIWLKNSDFFIHSSKYEGFGLVLVEAAFFNKLVISSNCKVGPSEILEYGKSGYLFNVGKFEELAGILENVILKEDPKVNKIIKNMEKSILRFDKNVVLKEYERLFDEN